MKMKPRTKILIPTIAIILILSSVVIPHMTSDLKTTDRTMGNKIIIGSSNDPENFLCTIPLATAKNYPLLLYSKDNATRYFLEDYSSVRDRSELIIMMDESGENGDNFNDDLSGALNDVVGTLNPKKTRYVTVTQISPLIFTRVKLL